MKTERKVSAICAGKKVTWFSLTMLAKKTNPLIVPAVTVISVSERKTIKMTPASANGIKSKR